MPDDGRYSPASVRRQVQVVQTQHGGRFPDYGDAAKALGRDPRTNCRFLGKVTDLIDGAAVLAGVPCIAIWTVRRKDGGVNPEAWTRDPYRAKPETKAKMIEEARRHTFTQADIDAIKHGLVEIRDMNNPEAWRYVLNKRFGGGVEKFDEFYANK